MKNKKLITFSKTTKTLNEKTHCISLCNNAFRTYIHRYVKQ